MSRSRRLLLAVVAALLAALLIVPVAGAAPVTNSQVTSQSLGQQESVTFNLFASNTQVGEIVTQETFFGPVSYGSWVLTMNGLQAGNGSLVAYHETSGLTAYLSMSTPDFGFATLSFTLNPGTTTGAGSLSYWVFVNGTVQQGSEPFSATEVGPQDYNVYFSQVPPIF